MRRTAVGWWGVAATAVVIAAVAVAAPTGGGEGSRIGAQPSALVIDRPGDVVLDVLGPTEGGLAQVIGWRTGGGPVEILVDGVVVATVTADQPRPDVALALGLSDDRVGFSGLIEPGDQPFLVCAVSPGAHPASGSCNRNVLDLNLHRGVALYGVPGTTGLGILGAGSARDARRRLQAQAKPYEQPDRPVIMVFEIIATVAQAFPGKDGDFSEPIPTEDIWDYLEEIRKVGGHVVLDFQTGRGDYLEQMRDVEELLREPDVHVALDPEWDMLPNQRPAEVLGHTTAREINEIMGYVNELVSEGRLPRKLVIVHNFREQMIRDRPDLAPPEGVQLALQMDGHGPPSIKIGNYRILYDDRFFTGFKLFYRRDFPLLGPDDVLGLKPPPDYVSYQ